MSDARQWLNSLGPELAVQARLLDRLLTSVEADPRWEWLELVLHCRRARRGPVRPRRRPGPRGSLLEGIEQIHRGRTRVLQLWAVGQGVAYPAFGLTSLLDDADAGLPPGIEATYRHPIAPEC